MRKNTVFLILMLFVVLGSQARQNASERCRVIISTDIGGTDPDDNQSVAHLLMYSNEFDHEGLVSTPSFGDGSTSEIFRMIDVYEKDLPRLSRHVKGLMKPKALRRLVKQGRMSEAPACGYGEPTEGSRWIFSRLEGRTPAHSIS